MLSLTLPDYIETEVKKLAAAEQHTADEMVLQLIVEALQSHKKQKDEDDALLIHEQLMDQYSDTFEKLAK